MFPALILNILFSTIKANRVDCFPCAKINTGDKEEEEEKSLLVSSNGDTHQPREGILRKIAKNYYGPFILHPISRIVIVSI